MTVRDPLDNEPLRTLVGLLQQMTEHVAVHTGYKGITRLSLSHEFGPCVGILPSTSIDVATAAGRVEIYCEAHPRAEGTFRISAPPSADGPVPPCRPGCERCAKALRVLGPVGYNNWRSFPDEVHDAEKADIDARRVLGDSGGIEARVGAYANMITEGPACCIPAPPDGWAGGFWRDEAHDTEEGK